MIWYLTNVDTEILALRVAVDTLPDGFPPVRAAQPWSYEIERDLDGATCVLVRLLGGRRAWEDGFDALRRRCIERGIPLLAFAGEAVPGRRADVPVDGAERHRRRRLRVPGQRRAAELLRAPPVRGRHGAAPGLRLRRTRGDPGPRRLAGERAERGPTPHRGRLLPGAPRGREHPVRHRPVRRDRVAGRRGGRRLVLLAAGRRGAARPRAPRRTRRGHPDHDRAGDGRARWPARAPWARLVGWAATSGTRRRWPRSVCPSCRRPRPGSPSTSGWPTTAACGRTTPRPGWPSRSSTGGSSARSSPSTRWWTTAPGSGAWCGPIAPFRTGGPASWASRCGRPAYAGPRPATSGS